MIKKENYLKNYFKIDLVNEKKEFQNLKLTIENEINFYNLVLIDSMMITSFLSDDSGVL